LLDGLAPLHEQGILHRDIKPDNVLVTPDGVVKLVDFGLAKGAGAVDPGGLMGTVFYMSPEQARTEEVTVSTDVFSMGVLLYEMLSGELPFKGDSVQSVIQKVCNADAPPLQIEGGLPVEIELILAQALAKDRANRFQTAAEFRDELLRILDEAAAVARINRRRWVMGSVSAVILFSALGIFLVSRFMEPEVDRAWVGQFNELGLAQASSGEVYEAQAKYEAILIADPHYAVAWNNLGLLKWYQGEFVAADSLLQRAIAEDSFYGEPWFNLALVYEDQDRIDDAKRCYRDAIWVAPDFGFAYNNLAFLLMDELRLEQAESVLAAGRDAIPEDHSSAPYLARTSGRLALMMEDGETALRFFDQARPGLDPEHWPELDSLIAEAKETLGER
jgi:tetratricopeptide (TPR) repeat protein